ncbi:cilia- and flagella-associated protein 97-like [Diabrotica virgifera virgifera]|uniref:Cilia- and flagella-associated protein 97-like n=1 Tax=Diabrotica virgifera virgifera TaxID=50390 RepID=A0ABM5KNX6_DIAVI|nr:cilia- and flagella-associated protein 97-like [Diabrotica virgifera virgifera]
MARAPRDGIGILTKLNDCTTCESIQNIAPSPSPCELSRSENFNTSSQNIEIKDASDKNDSSIVSDSDSEEISYDDDFEPLEADDDDKGHGDSRSVRSISSQSQSSFCASTTLKLPNRTFPDSEIREIERQNDILMKKILSNNRRPNQYKPRSTDFRLPSSAAVNRKRQEAKIARENQILLRKIQTVKSSFQK